MLLDSNSIQAAPEVIFGSTLSTESATSTTYPLYDDLADYNEYEYEDFDFPTETPTRPFFTANEYETDVSYP